MKTLISILLSLSLSVVTNAQWSEIGRYAAWPLSTDNAGNLYAGYFRSNGMSPNSWQVAKWNGSTWLVLDSSSLGSSQLREICLDSLENVYAAGGIKNSLGKYYVAKWDGANWSEVGNNINSLAADSSINSICFDRAGNLYAAGRFTNSNGKKYVAKWDGNSWTELGAGSNSLSANGEIRKIRTDISGNIYAAGRFTNVGGKCYVAKWDGISWSELGSGANSLNANGFVYGLCTGNDGNIYAGGFFTNNNNKCYVAKWNGSNWSEMGTASSDTLDNGSYIGSLEKDPLGNLYASMYKYRPAYNYGHNYLIKWDGNQWNELGGTYSLKTDDDVTFCFDPQGNLYATGAYNSVGSYSYIAKYTGAYNASIATAQNGDWNNPATWQNNIVPPPGAIVIIRHNVTVNINTVCYAVTMQPGGNITVASGIQFTVLH
jgi:hypothetical protein